MIDMTSVSALVGGSAVVGIMFSCWGRIMGIARWMIGLFIATARLDSITMISFMGYASKNGSIISMTPIAYCALFAYITSVGRRCNTVMEDRTGSPKIIWMKGSWLPMLISESCNHSSKASNENSQYGIASVTYIRFTVDFEKILINAMYEYDKDQHDGIENSTSNRFKVLHVFGNRGRSQELNECAKPIVDDRNGINNIKRSCRLLGYDINELVEERPSSKPYLEYLAYPDNVLEHVRDMEKWLKSRDWYKARGIPWTRGWLLIGRPGTGKTALVRAIGEMLDLPIAVFDLTSFDNKDFVKAWRKTQAEWTPCIILLEDIDAVFDGRKSLMEGGIQGSPLTFDCLLNTLDGADKSGGIFTVITTNHPETLDHALCQTSTGESSRPGRIDRMIELVPMDKKCREKLASIILDKWPEEKAALVEAGEGCTAAQFQDRCARVALKRYWDARDASEKNLKNMRKLC